MGKPDDITMYLIRAGVTAWDEAGRLQGDTDLPLAEQGETTARDTVAALTTRAFGAIVSGPDEASVATAALLAKGRDVKPKRAGGLAEPALGLWEGLRDMELTGRYAKSYGKWREDPASVQPPEGEAFEEAEARILSALGKILEKAPVDPLVISARPMTAAIITCWIDGKSSDEVWSVRDTLADVTERTISRSWARERVKERQWLARAATKR